MPHIRVRDEDVERLRRIAEAEDRPMTVVVGRALELYERRKRSAASGARLVADVDAIVERVGPRLSTDPVGCAHPKPMQTFNGYMTRCDPTKGGCGAKVR